MTSTETKAELKEKAVKALNDYVRILDTMPNIRDRSPDDWLVLNELDAQMRRAEQRYNHYGILDAKV